MVVLVYGDYGHETVPEDQAFVDLEFGEEETVEPLDAGDAQIVQVLRMLL